MICLNDKQVKRAFKKLNEYGLIEEIRQGLNRPNLIYVGHIDYTDAEDMRTRTITDSKNALNRIISDSRVVHSPTLESENVRASYTDLSNTNLSNTEKVYIDLPVNENSYYKIYNSFYLQKFSKQHMKVSGKNHL